MNGNCLVSCLEQIPKKLADDFFDTLRITFPDFRDTDTKGQGSKHTYPSAHVDAYGRYTNRVCAISSPIHSSNWYWHREMVFLITLTLLVFKKKGRSF
jgi:hypothetical protein